MRITKAVHSTARISLPAGVCIALLCMVSGGVSVAASNQPGKAACELSDGPFNADAVIASQAAPTHFHLMTSRYVEAVQAARGYDCSGIGSVAFDGRHFFQAGRADDFGLAELVPFISRTTGMTLTDSFDLTVLLILLASAALGFTGFVQLCDTRQGRTGASVLFVLLLLCEAVVADVYVFQAAAFVAGLPWLVYFARKGLNGKLLAASFCFAFFCSWISLVRSGTLLLCFAFLVPLAMGRRPLWKGIVVLALAASACVPATLFARQTARERDAFLSTKQEAETGVTGHPFWHSIYIGLGFVRNSEVPGYADGVAIARVASIDASAPFVSPRYEAILKSEVIRIAKDKPQILIANVAAKAAILLVVGIVILFPARRAVLSKRTISWEGLAFALAIGASGMAGILVMPKPRYLLTYVCLMMMYSAIRYFELVSHDSLGRAAQPELTAAGAGSGR